MLHCLILNIYTSHILLHHVTAVQVASSHFTALRISLPALVRALWPLPSVVGASPVRCDGTCTDAECVERMVDEQIAHGTFTTALDMKSSKADRATGRTAADAGLVCSGERVKLHAAAESG